MSIQAIDQTSIHRLTSGQVIVDLQTAVKELLENALDSGATSVEVRFKEHGIDAIEVQDNGKGIEPADWPSIALKHHTSKLTTFDDLTTVSTLGFRGEALSSLCGTASLSLVTSTSTTAPVGTALSFTQAGECVVGAKAARPRGTTVVVKELFGNLPVRRKELVKNKKREFGKALDGVMAYALIKTGVRIEVKGWVNGKASTHLQTSAASTLRSNFSSVFGPKALASMDDLELELEVTPDKSVAKWSEEGEAASTKVVVKGLISKPTTGNGRSTNNRQFFYINGRPFNPTKISKAFNEVYKNFNTNSFPCVVADFQLPTDTYDVNVSPDKRTIFLHSEDHLISALKTALEDFFQPSRSTFAMSQIGATNAGNGRVKSETSSSKRKADEEPEDEEGGEAEGESSQTKGKDEDAAVEEEAMDIDVGTDVAQERGKGREPRAKKRKSDLGGEGVGEQDPQNSQTPLESDGPIAGPSGSHPLSQSQPPNRQSTSSPSSSGGVKDARPPSPPPYIIPAPLRQLTLDGSTSSLALEKNSVSVPGSNLKKPGLSKAGKVAMVDLKKFLLKHSGWTRESKNASADGEGEGEEQDELEEAAEEDEDENENEDEEGNEEEDEDDPGASEEANLEVDDAPAPDDMKQDREDNEGVQDVDMIVVEDSFKPPPTRRKDSHPSSNNDDSDDEIIVLDPPPPATLNPPDELEIMGDEIPLDVTLSFKVDSIQEVWSHRPLPARSSASEPISHSALADASIGADTGSAEATLSRVVSKEDFEQMVVIGQFNLGFIIARRKRFGLGKGKCKQGSEEEEEEEQDDLFIIDQHASDEKFNFEKLQNEAVIDSQRLILPRSLELAYNAEATAMENIDVLRMNGFEVAVDEDASVGQRVKLVAQPVSKKTVFGVEDLDELLELIAAHPSGDMSGVRPSKVRKMLASRACRKSVMIGTALTGPQMTGVVRHMAKMDQPWACPHGRPTMRWLAKVQGRPREDARRTDLAAFLEL